MLLTRTTATPRAGITRPVPKLPTLRQTRVCYRTDSDTEVTPASRSELRNKAADRLADQSRRASDAVSTLETPELQQMEVEEIRELEVEDGVQRTLDRLQAKWQSIQDKRTVVVLGLGSLLATWLASKTLDAVNHIPILPIGDLLTFVGLIFSANFTWRFLLFSEGRKELKETVSDLYQNARDTIEADPTLAPITDATLEKVDEPERPLSTSSSNGSQQNGQAKRNFSGWRENGGNIGLGSQQGATGPQSPAPARTPVSSHNRGSPAEARNSQRRPRYVRTAATASNAPGAESDPPPAPKLPPVIEQQHNTTANPDPAAAPHQSGPGSVTDDKIWLDAAASASASAEEGGVEVDCSQQPHNTTPCPVPGSAPHREDLVYNDDMWYNYVQREDRA